MKNAAIIVCARFARTVCDPSGLRASGNPAHMHGGGRGPFDLDYILANTLGAGERRPSSLATT